MLAGDTESLEDTSISSSHGISRTDLTCNARNFLVHARLSTFDCCEHVLLPFIGQVPACQVGSVAGNQMIVASPDARVKR